MKRKLLTALWLVWLVALAFFTAPASANSIVAFGLDFHYELGIGFKQYAVTQPLAVQNITEAQQLVAGGAGSGVVLANGDLLIAGGNAFGQAGNGRQWIPSPSPVVIAHGIAQASEGTGDGVAVTKAGTVLVWGSGNYGQLGNGQHGEPNEVSAIKTAVAVPTPVPGITEARQVLSAGASEYALLANGTVEGWGEGAKGQLGEPTVKVQDTPRLIAGLSGIVEIAGTGGAKAETTLLARRSDGSILTVGSGDVGQRGNGSTKSSGTPEPVKGITGASKVAGSHSNGAAIVNGQAYTWGNDADGGLGYVGTESCREGNPAPCSMIARPVSGLTSTTDIDVGNQTFYAINAGSLYGSGRNEWGQLGIGTQTAVSRPVLILANALKVAALDIGALVETNATTRPPTKITGSCGATSCTVKWTGGKAGETFNVGIQVCTGGPKERSTKSHSVGRTTAHTTTIPNLHGEYEIGVGGPSFPHANVRVHTTP